MYSEIDLWSGDKRDARIVRHNPRIREVLVLFADATEPPVFNAVAKVFRHAHPSFTHKIHGDGTEADYCDECEEMTNYRFTDEELRLRACLGI